jgi:hypothetical protein
MWSMINDIQGGNAGASHAPVEGRRFRQQRNDIGTFRAVAADPIGPGGTLRPAPKEA